MWPRTEEATARQKPERRFLSFMWYIKLFPGLISYILAHGLYSFVYLADTKAWKLWVTKACYFNIVVKPQESIKDGMGESSLQVIF